MKPARCSPKPSTPDWKRPFNFDWKVIFDVLPVPVRGLSERSPYAGKDCGWLKAS
jgi:hypothetical protein